jgi:LysM repeat protein
VEDGLDTQWEASPAAETNLVPPPRERPPVRRLPDLEPPVQDEPIQLTQLEEEEPVPIVDRPPRAAPQPEPEPVPVATPVRRTAPVPVALPEEPAVEVATRPGLRETLAPIHLIEDKGARGKALLERNAIDKALQLGDHPTALRELSRWYWRHPDLRHELHPQLEELAKIVYFSPRPHFYEPYVIQPNDRLQNVARKYQVPWEYLCRVNNVNAKKIRAGQKLKVVDGPFSAFVSLSNYELIVHHKGAFVRWYPVGVGKDGSSPVGTFAVKEKLVNPTYYGDDGLMAADDPKNPLGERWIDIGDSFGIHGTIDPASIGKNESRGCIRLLSEDVEELYDLISVGSQVVIQR